MNKQGGLMENAELIKALKEDAEWAHANEWETPITLGDHLDAAADALGAADKRTHFLADNDYPVEGQRVMFWDVDNQQWVSGYYDAPHWEADYGRVDALCWQPLPQPPQKGE